jgi:hypothetical protein
VEDKIRIAELKWRLGRGRQGSEPAWVQSRAGRTMAAVACEALHPRDRDSAGSVVGAGPAVRHFAAGSFAGAAAGVSVTGFKAAFVAAAGAGVLAEVPARF